MKTWSGAFPIMIGLAAVAFATHSMCKNSDKRTTEYQLSLVAVFLGVLCAFCGIVMMGSGMGINLFTTGPVAGTGAGYGGGSWW